VTREISIDIARKTIVPRRKCNMVGITRTVAAAVMAMTMVLIAGAIQAQENPPKADKMRKLSFPAYKEFKTKNNIDVFVVEHHEQPIVAVGVVIRAGTSFDPKDKMSLASFVVDQLNKGTKNKDANELAAWIESVGGEVVQQAGEDFSYVIVEVLSEHIDVAYEYLSDILLNPTFPEAELEIFRKRVKTALELELSNPKAMAQRHLRNLVYGDHPYSKQPTVQTVEAITRQDMVDFYKKNYVANNAVMAVVGDVKWKQASKSIAAHLGRWQEGTPDEVTFPGIPVLEKSGISLYHKPGAVQTEIHVGHVGLKAGDPDWPAVTVANKILGGGADARLFANLREEKGWTYGAYSSFSKNKDAGLFEAWAAVGTGVTDSALTELMYELKRIDDEAVSKEDLNNAKSYLIGSFPLGIETPSQIAEKIITVKLLGLDQKELETYRERISKVTIPDVSRVTRKHFHPDNAHIVLVGDAAEILDKVGQIAPVSLYDIEGAPFSLADMEVQPVDYGYNTDVLGDMTATYALTVRGMPLGDLNVSLKKKGDGEKGIIEVSSNMSGMLTLNETMEFRAADLAPVSFKRKMKIGPQSMEAELAFTENSGSGVVQGMQSPEPKEVTFALVDGVILDGALEYAIGCLPLEVNKKYRFPVVDSQSGSLQNVQAQVLEVVQVETAAGSFSVYKIKIKRPEGEAFFYIGKDSPHILVKQEVPAQSMILELKSVAN
jgi:predicted Zn-dependent peptidase